MVGLPGFPPRRTRRDTKQDEEAPVRRGRGGAPGDRRPAPSGLAGWVPPWPARREQAGASPLVFACLRPVLDRAGGTEVFPAGSVRQGQRPVRGAERDEEVELVRAAGVAEDRQDPPAP